MSDTHETLLAAAVQDVSTWHEYSALPLHVRILPVFQVESSRVTDLSRQLEILTERRTFGITGLEEDIADNGGGRIRRVGGSVLWAVYDDTLPIAQRFDSSLANAPTSAEFTPYVTDVDNYRLGQGRKVKVKELFLAQRGYATKGPQNWRIVERFRLADYDAESGARFGDDKPIERSRRKVTQE